LCIIVAIVPCHQLNTIISRPKHTIKKIYTFN
jgi:hypothetical protein